LPSNTGITCRGGKFMSSKEQILELLARTALFGSLDDTERKAVAQEMRETTLEPGQAIFGRGDPGKEIYLVTSGRVRLSILTSEGRELSFAHAETGQVFGEIAVFDGVTRVTACTLSKPSLMRLIETRPAVRNAALRFLCQRVREADQQLEGIALYPIEARLARFFLTAARQKAGVDCEGKVALDLPISQGELALLIGASRPKVNAALALLEDQGAIERGGGSFVCHLEELEEIAGAS
jgi:CRP/FNR family transcriptional regulator, cyclic AMP receptor protein